MANFHCPFCSYQLPTAQLGAGLATLSCLACNRPVQARVFRSLLEADKPKPPLLPDPPAEGEASCFYNPARRATASCKHCGVLISGLWTAQWGNDTVCLKCLDHLREKGKDERFETGRTLWDNIVLALAVWPFIPPLTAFYCFIPVTAPAAAFLGIWHWKTPRSLVKPGRMRLVFGLLLAVLEIGLVALGGKAFYQEIVSGQSNKFKVESRR